MTTDDTLFDASPFHVPEVPSSDPTLSPDQRRTLRQREAVAAGVHPLTKGPIHPLATPKAATPGGPKTARFTCGSCCFRQLFKHHDRTYPKCVRDGNVSHGGATDVRAWWPACTGYEVNR